MRTRMDQMWPGAWAVIREIEETGLLRRRLLDFGMIEGTRVYCERVSPFGDPMLFWVRGCRLALGKKEGRGILVEMGERK